MSRIASILATISVVGLTACGSAPSPLAPSLVPASAVLGLSDATNGPPPMDVGRSHTVSPIVIDRGELDLSSGSGVISLHGTRGFSLSARVDRIGVVEAFDTCVAWNCAPGAPIPLGAAWSGNDLPATVTFDGTTYTDVGSLASVTTAAVQFSGSLVAPPVPSRGSETATAPFTLEGRFVHGTADLPVTETFKGEGVARVWLVNRQGGTGWSVERVVYKFKHPK